MVKIKICGITSLEDALAAAGLGADALGFNFFRESPRSITPEKAAEIIFQLPPFVTAVGVFVNETEERVREIQKTGISVLQFHGDETPEFCERFGGHVIKAFQIKDKESLHSIVHYSVSAVLLDAHKEGLRGGTGETFNWDLAKQIAPAKRVVLAGGLTPDNVALAIKTVRPYAVDVAGGVEKAKGIKDHEKMRKFITEARKAGKP